MNPVECCNILNDRNIASHIFDTSNMSLHSGQRRSGDWKQWASPPKTAHEVAFGHQQGAGVRSNHFQIVISDLDVLICI